MIRKIIISRTDKIGDVILTLPMLAVLKQHMPEVVITFLGNTYTRPILECCPLIDEIIEWNILEKLAGKEQTNKLKELNADAILHVFPNKLVAKAALNAGIYMRSGTSHRLHHWLYCNSLVHFSRRKSDLHESQLNLRLLKSLGIDLVLTMQQLAENPLLTNIPVPDEKTSGFIDVSRTNIIFHPHSKGSAREWPIENYITLCGLLPEEGFNIIFAGTEDEARMYRPFLKNTHREFKDAGGQLTLRQYISLINLCNGLIAASTGPLHIAAALGKHAFGIYPPIRPMHPGRWAPLGKNVHVFVRETECNLCKKSGDCQCMKDISPDKLREAIVQVFENSVKKA